MKNRRVALRPAWFGLLACALIMLACSRAGAGASPSTTSSGTPQPGGALTGDSTGSLVVGGVTRTYFLHVPPSYTGQNAVPLVVALHGRDGTGQGMVKLTHFSTVADANGFIVVYPDGIDRSWNDGRQIPEESEDDVGFLRALISQLAGRYHIDPARIYATGISNGGMMTQRLGCELGDVLAAIAPDAGEMPVPENAVCHPPHHLSVLEFQGDADPYIPYAGGTPRCAPNLSTCGTVLSADDTMRGWASRDGCQATYASANLPDVAKGDGPLPSRDSTIEQRTYQGCPAGSAVVLEVIHGGGHTWPGGWQYLPPALIGWTNRDIDASQMIWQFFAAHPRA